MSGEEPIVAESIALLGQFLVRVGDEGAPELRAKIIEVEAYSGQGDKGSHAYRGVTPRNSVMFGRRGIAYVYLNYGIHFMLNVVGLEEGVAGATLLRAAVPVEGLDVFWERRPKAKGVRELLNGPGKLAAAFGISGQHTGSDLFAAESEIRIEPGEKVTRVLAGPRVGLGPHQAPELPWRFVSEADLEFASPSLVSHLRPI